jgi:hypothetical protein
MAQIVKLRRSSVPGQKPTNSNLQLGELALNTTDGKVYMAKSGSLGPSVEELISTNTVNTGSIYLTGDVTASNFSGSFIGDGADLYNIPASGITGLNLSMIADGNATASISNTEGLRINTNTEITGSLIVSSGSAVFDAALQLTENSSLILNSGSNLYVYDGGIISGTFKGNGALLTDLPYATTASNQFFGDQIITGSVFITQNLTVLGSSSISYVTSSQLEVATSFITVNVFEPAERFGGLKVYDSGSSTATASLAWDSVRNHWIYQNASGSSYSGGMFLAGPRNTGSLGDEVGLTSTRIPKSIGGDHLDNSNIADNGTTVTINSNTEITGSLTVTGGLIGSIDYSNVTNKPTLVSGSSQITITGTTDYTTFSSSISTSIGDLSSSIATTTSNLSSSVGSLSSSVATTTFNVENRLDSIEGVTGSYATTGSNVFIGDQTITGSLFVSNSFFVGSGTNDIVRIKALISSSLIPDSDGIHHFVGAQNKRWEAVYAKTGSFEEIHGTLGSIVNIFHATVSGSFTGDGTGLYNIPASGVTGLQLDKIINGNASASIDDTGLYVNRNVYIDGTLTAKELHIDYVTSSVLYQSGSTKFGDSSDDNHNFTGSVYIGGNLNVDSITGSLSFDNLTDLPTLVSGSSQIEITGTTGYSTFSGSISSSIDTLSSSIALTDYNQELRLNSIESFTSSYATGSFTGSFIGDGSGLLDIPFLISGSNIYGTTVNKTFTKLQFDDSTGLNVEETTPGTAFISIGSHFKDIFVSGSPILSATGSDAFEIIPAGGIEITTSTSDTNGNGYVKELNISATSLSSSLNDRIDIITGSVDSLNLFTSSVVLTSETGSMTVLSSSYALTASFALNAGGGAEGRSAKLTQSSPATTWTFNHNLGEQYPEVTVYDSLGYVVIPTNILAYSNNQMIITFSSAQSGTVTATVGGGLPAISASYAGYVLSNNGTSPSWKSGMVSGSLQITEFGYATTGSNTFTNNQVINGTLTINNAKIGTVCTPLASTTTVLNLSTFDGVNMDYVIKKSGNMRAGNVMGVWSGSDVKYSETSTMDIGDTSEFTFTINNTGAVTANFTSGTWVVEIFYRAIGGCS